MAYYPKYTGSSKSLSDALKAVGVNNSFSYRKTIAAANGISNYTGTAQQNTALLSLLKQGKLVKVGSASSDAPQTPTTSSAPSPAAAQPTTPSSTSSSTNSPTPMVIVKNEDGSDIYFKSCSPSQMSIDNALREIGEGNMANFSSRKKIALANGMTSYSGTAAQNMSLLNLLKKGMLKRPTGEQMPSSTSPVQQPATSASQYNAPTNTSTAISVQQNPKNENNNTNPLKKFFMQLTDKQKKALKIGGIVVGVGLVSYAAYKATKKNASASAPAAVGSRKAKAALNGVSKKRRKKKSSTKRRKKGRRGAKKVNLV